MVGYSSLTCLVGLSADIDQSIRRSMAAFASFNMDEFLCYGIWDTGATGTMAGLDGMQELVNAYQRMHGQTEDVIVDTNGV